MFHALKPRQRRRDIHGYIFHRYIFHVPNSHSQDVLDMEYARRRAFNLQISEFGINLTLLITDP